MKKTRAFIVVSSCQKKKQPRKKVEGIFFKKRNAKNYAWQLNVQSTDLSTGELYTVEPYSLENNNFQHLEKKLL